MLLQLVSFAWDIGGYFEAIRQANAGDLPQGGIRFLGCRGSDHSANTAFLWRAFFLADTSLTLGIKRVLKCRSFALDFFGLASFSNQLVNRWHVRLQNNFLYD